MSHDDYWFKSEKISTCLDSDNEDVRVNFPFLTKLKVAVFRKKRPLLLET